MKKIIILIALIMMTGCGAPTAEIPENPLPSKLRVKNTLMKIKKIPII